MHSAAVLCDLLEVCCACRGLQVVQVPFHSGMMRNGSFSADDLKHALLMLGVKVAAS